MANHSKSKNRGRRIVYCKYIVKNGRRIYPKHGKVFRFWVDSSNED